MESIRRLGLSFVGPVPTRILTLFVAGNHRASVHESVFVKKMALFRTQRFLYALEHMGVARAAHGDRSITTSRVGGKTYFAKGQLDAHGNSRAQYH